MDYVQHVRIRSDQGEVIRNLVIEHIGFGLLDDRGRRIGIHVYTGEVITRERTGEDSTYLELPYRPGRLFVGRTWITRDGEPFGAVQSYQYYDDEYERDADLSRKVKSAKERMARKFKGHTKGGKR